MGDAAFLFGEPTHEYSLEGFGLTEELIHDCIRPAWTHSRGRTSLAAPSTPGSDLYHDITENLAVALTNHGWHRRPVNGQQRTIHPDGLIAIAVSSAVNVANSDPKKHPRTRPKGPATLDDLDVALIPGQQAFDLEEFRGNEDFEQMLQEAPLWFLLHEEVEEEMRISLARPAQPDKQGSIVGFSREIPIESLRLDTDLDIFRNDDEDGGIDFDVPSIQ
ncbi:hypothetical protein [Psychromicrobium xiongbiense]|uniref:hypothetical protein n=1 Tax=Psychromicrobium xiongbiense TaxID=3051184 RepID=UPI0025548845|nr:hypothetical protein [Psychromicrobium sp. YIM S02556]